MKRERQDDETGARLRVKKQRVSPSPSQSQFLGSKRHSAVLRTLDFLTKVSTWDVDNMISTLLTWDSLLGGSLFGAQLLVQESHLAQWGASGLLAITNLAYAAPQPLRRTFLRRAHVLGRKWLQALAARVGRAWVGRGRAHDGHDESGWLHARYVLRCVVCLTQKMHTDASTWTVQRALDAHLELAVARMLCLDHPYEAETRLVLDEIVGKANERHRLKPTRTARGRNQSHVLAFEDFFGWTPLAEDPPEWMVSLCPSCDVRVHLSASQMKTVRPDRVVCVRSAYVD